MAANLITRQIQTRIFLQILNGPVFRRLFNALSNEEITEFEIVNNTLKVKLINQTKLTQYKRGQLRKQDPASITNLSSKDRFELGRFNSVNIATVINLLNNNNTLKGRFGLRNEEKIQTIDMYGSTSVIVRAYNIEELRREQQTERPQYGVNVRSARGIR